MMHVQKVLECKSQDKGAKGNSGKLSLRCRFQLKAGRENCLHKRHPLVYMFWPWHVLPIPHLSLTPPSLVVIYFLALNLIQQVMSEKEEKNIDLISTCSCL